MSAILATATFEEFLDSVRMLGAVRLVGYVVLAAAVVRLAKRGPIGSARMLGAGLGLLCLAEAMQIATQFGWINLVYSPAYASMRLEWEMGEADWGSWEPLFWWTQFLAGWLGMMLAAVGFVRAGRALVGWALRRDVEGGRMTPGK